MGKDRSMRNAKAGNDLCHGVQPSLALQILWTARTDQHDRRAALRQRAADLVDLHGAHALVVGLHVEPTDFETRQIVHKEGVDAHPIQGADIACEQLLSLVVGEIKRGKRFRRIGSYGSTEAMVAQHLATKVVHRENRHRHLRSTAMSLATGERSLSFAQIVIPVPVTDLASSRDPDLPARCYVSESLIEILAAMRMPDQERVQTDRHDPPGLHAIFVEHVELVADHSGEGLRSLTLVEEHRNVV